VQTQADISRSETATQWSIKHIHRLILLSATYQQSSQHPLHDRYSRDDAANRLWWRAERRRLDADALRDALLAASDQLDVRLGGPSFRPTISPEALEGLSRKSGAWKESPPQEQRRRTIYTYLQRSLLPPLLTTFDQADTTLPCGQRDVTTVAPQALALLNNDFVHEQSRAVAALLEHWSDDAERIDAAWRLTLGRSPTSSEREAALRHVREQEARFAHLPSPPQSPRRLAWESLCHVLLNTNEFVYVD